MLINNNSNVNYKSDEIDKEINMINKIKAIKEKMGEDLLILAHHYQTSDIVSLADKIGDSLKLAQFAQQNKRAKHIVFCGVHFMAETADILTEDWQQVYLPASGAGCPMADMADRDAAEKCWKLLIEEFGDDSIVPITYINSKAEVKAFCGVHGGTSVTSGNAGKVLEWGLKEKKRVLFLPDQNLGRNTAFKLGVKLENMALYDYKNEKLIYDCPKEDVKMILWNGFCHVHHKITKEIFDAARKNNPEAKIIVHPECQYEIASIADGSGSTEYLINAVKNAPAGSSFVVGTEANLVGRIAENNPDKTVKLLDTNSHCTNMNKTNLENLLETLEEIQEGKTYSRITVDKQTADEAVKALDVMLSLS
jgi:quinolinate synthase